MSSRFEMHEAQGVMEMSKDYVVPNEMNVGGLFLALRRLVGKYSVSFDTKGAPRDAEGKLIDYLGFTATINEHRTSIAIYRSSDTALTVNVTPETNHSCAACDTMWGSIQDMIYKYIRYWENAVAGCGQRGDCGVRGVRRPRDVPFEYEYNQAMEEEAGFQAWLAHNLD